MIYRFYFLGLFALISCVSTLTGEEKLRKVSFVPLWSPQAQFAGYYTALEKGIYKEHGLDVSIIEGGPNAPAHQYLKAGKADFGILWLSSALKERSRGLPIVNIAQLNQRSALMLIAKRSSGINAPSDMNGRKISIWEGDLQIQPKAFIKKYNLNVTIIPQTITINLFLRGGVDVISAMWYNEYHTVLNAGLNNDELTTFFYDQHGLNFPEDGIYALETTAVKEPELCRAFVEASLEGWEYAFTHEEEALDIILKYMAQAKLPANRVHQKWMLGKMKELIIPGGDKSVFGKLKKDDYERVASELIKTGDIKSVPALEKFYKPALNK